METYEEALQVQISYLEDSLKNLQGVTQGYLIRNEIGEVISRVGRMSLNPIWYQEFYKQHGRRPYKKELNGLAKKHLEEGFYDSFGFIPPFHDREG